MNDINETETKKTDMGNIRVYQDSINRLIVGEFIDDLGELWLVKNPLILHVQTVEGQINIQFFPIMFKEFQADKDEATVWEVYKKNITMCRDLVLDARLVSQYKNIFSPVRGLPPAMNTTPSMQTGSPQAGPPAQGAQPQPTTVNLFDDPVT